MISALLKLFLAGAFPDLAEALVFFAILSSAILGDKMRRNDSVNDLKSRVSELFSPIADFSSLSSGLELKMLLGPSFRVKLP